MKEEGKVKCQQYWPDSGTKDYGPFSVTLSDEQVLTEYIIRKIHLTVREWTKYTNYSKFFHLVIEFRSTSIDDHTISFHIMA